jgi:hypothetical protein
MTIRSISTTYGQQRVGAQPPASPKAPEAPAASKPTPRSDSVSISDAGRALSGGEAPAARGAGSLTPERIDALRKKVLEGAYNSTHVVDAVAKRLLGSGDV